MEVRKIVQECRFLADAETPGACPALLAHEPGLGNGASANGKRQAAIRLGQTDPAGCCAREFQNRGKRLAKVLREDFFVRRSGRFWNNQRHVRVQ